MTAEHPRPGLRGEGGLPPPFTMIPRSRVSEWRSPAPSASPGLFVARDIRCWDGEPLLCHDSDHLIICLRHTPQKMNFSGHLGPVRIGHSGGVSIMPAGVSAIVHPQPGQVTRAWLFGFRMDHFERLTGTGNQWFVDRLDQCLDVRSPTLEFYLRRLAEETDAPGFGSPTLNEALGNAAFVTLVRYLLGEEAQDTNGQLPMWRINRIRAFVEANPASACGIEELAQLCGISGKHLGRAFRLTTGVTIQAFVQDIRLDAAKRLLADTQLPIKEIAHRSGFSHASNFSTAFRRLTGSTPNAFRSAG